MDRVQRRLFLGLFGGAAVLFTVFVAVVFAGGRSVDAAADGRRAPVGAEASRRPTVTVRDSDYGRILFDGDGRALYAFTRDARGASACEGDCAATWPPYVIAGSPQAGARVDRSLLATIRRSDGRRQVTYAGRPLYYFVGDRRPGQALCQNVVEFGGTWLVLRPTGRLVR